MNQSYIFGGNTGLSYDQIQKQRDIANELLRANMYTPKNVGEGLSAIGRALAAKAIDKRTARADEANRAASAERRASAFGSIFGGAPSGGASGGPAPFSSATSSAEVGPAASVANDTMAVLGNFSALEQQHNLPPGYLNRTYMIESGGNPMAQNPNSSADGPFQFIDSTAKAYGLTDKFDIGSSAAAAARLAADNKAILTQALGREPTAGELYLAHQQGGGGAAKLLANPNARALDIVGADAVRLNGGNENMTASEFSSKWVGKFGEGQPAPAGNMSMGNPATIQMIADLLADPYTPPGEKAMLEQAMAMQLQGMDPMRQMEMERARLELDQLRNPQPGFTTLTDEQEAQMGLDTSGLYQQGADGKLYTVQEPAKPAEDPTAVREYNFYTQQEQAAGRPVKSFDEWKKGNAKAGAASTTVITGENSSAFTKKSDEAAAARFDGYVQAGANANKMMGDINALVELAPLIGTGKEAEFKAAIGPYAEAVGIDVEGLGEAQAFQSIVDRMAPAMRPIGSGSSSDFDAKQFLSSLPQLGRTPEGNQIIMQTLTALQQHQIAAADLASRSYLAPDDPNFLTWQEAEKKIRELGDPYTTFNEFKKSLPKEPKNPTEAPTDQLSAEERAYLGLE